MKPPYTKEELDSYFASFERMGEASVRAAINSDSWRYDQLRLGAANEWIRQKDEARKGTEPKPWRDMKDRLVQGVVFDQPIEVSGQDISTESTPMLYQPPFYLSEQNFEKIRRPSGKLAGFGWSCVGLSVFAGFRLLLKLAETRFSQASVASSKLEAMVIIVVLLFGVMSVVLGSRFSHSKNEVLKEIKRHFESNPPKLEIRHTRRINERS
jgi:hypothetical protein